MQESQLSQGLKCYRMHKISMQIVNIIFTPIVYSSQGIWHQHYFSYLQKGNFRLRRCILTKMTLQLESGTSGFEFQFCNIMLSVLYIMLPKYAASGRNWYKNLLLFRNGRIRFSIKYLSLNLNDKSVFFFLSNYFQLTKQSHNSYAC